MTFGPGNRQHQNEHRRSPRRSRTWDVSSWISPSRSTDSSPEATIVPLLLGEGVRLFDHLGPDPIALEQIRVIESEGVTHLRYRVGRG
jgi:hypothetical protein